MTIAVGHRWNFHLASFVAGISVLHNEERIDQVTGHQSIEKKEKSSYKPCRERDLTNHVSDPRWLSISSRSRSLWNPWLIELISVWFKIKNEKNNSPFDWKRILINLSESAQDWKKEESRPLHREIFWRRMKSKGWLFISWQTIGF